jgi:hypothetical protein
MSFSQFEQTLKGPALIPNDPETEITNNAMKNASTDAKDASSFMGDAEDFEKYF